MSEVDVSCACGAVIRISEFAVGMPMPCPQCDRDLDYTRIRPVTAPGPAPVEQFTAPRDQRSTASPSPRAPQQGARVAFTPAAKPEPVPGGHAHCARCGRRFRGEWDVHETSSGPLCHICANRVAESAPQEAVDNHVEPMVSIQLPGSRKAAGFLDDDGEAPSLASKVQFDPKSPTFRRLLYVAAIGVFLVTIYAFMTEGGLPTPHPNAPDAASAHAPMGRIPFILTLAIQALCAIGGTSVTLFLTLWYRNSLPLDRWWTNALHVGVVGLVLGAVQTGLLMVPMIGWICAVVVTCWVLAQVYDFGFVDFVTFMFMGIPSALLVNLVRVGLLGLVAHFLI